MMGKMEFIYWQATIKQANEGNKEAIGKIQTVNKLRAQTGQPTIEEEIENIHYLQNKNLFESSFLTNADTIFSLIKKEKYDETLEQFTCVRVPLAMELKIELCENKGYGSYSKPYILFFGEMRSYDIFRNLKIEPNALGAWQAFLLFNLWHVLPVFWHGNYAKRTYILRNDDLEHIQHIPQTIKCNLDVSPIITQEYNVFTVSCCYWSAFQGLVRETVKVGFDNNKAITLQCLQIDLKDSPDYKQEVLFKYHCGIEF